MRSPITAYLEQVHAEIAHVRGGEPYRVGSTKSRSIDPDDFGIALATVDGQVYEAGATAKEFSLQSLSKPLSYGLALTDLGADAVDVKVDVEPSGDPFNEISLDSQTGRPANAMINAGALAVVSLIKGSGGRTAIQRIDEFYAAFAGRQLRRSEHAYRSELRHSDRNHALAYLLSSVGVIEGRPTRALQTYLRQCTVQVTCRDLAMIAATLANGGTNPVTEVQALDTDATVRVLSIMMTAGMYDDAGDWVSTVGMPAKSGVGGGVIAVLPGQAGLAVYSPPLNRHGNSVRGVATCRRVARDMEMHFVRTARTGRSAIRARYTIDQEPSRIRRTDEAAAVLAEHSHRAVVMELTGDLYFAGTESLVRELSDLADDVEFIVLDARRLDEVSDVALEMLSRLAAAFTQENGEIVLVDPSGMVAPAFAATEATHRVSRERAVAFCEDRLLSRYGTPDSSPAVVPVQDSPVLSLLDPSEAAELAAMMHRRRYDDGEVIRRVGQRFGGVYFVRSGDITITAPDPTGGRVQLSVLSAGMTFGDLALGEDDRQETTAKADGPVDVMVLEAETIEAIERDNPELAIGLWRALARNAYSHAERYAREAVERAER